MHPILFEFKIFGYKYIITSYGVLILAGITAGILLTLHLNRLRDNREKDCFIKLLLVVSWGFLFAALVSFLIFLPSIIKTRSFLKGNFGIVSWGGILGAVFCIAFIAKRFKNDFLAFCDLILPGFVLAHSIGRVGCYLAGCCYGKITSSSLGVIYKSKISPAYSLSCAKHALYPTQLISAIFLFVLFILLFVMFILKARKGLITASYLMLYPCFRFAIEFYRSDPRGFLLGLSDAQVVSIFMFACGLLLLYFVHKKRKALFQG